MESWFIAMTKVQDNLVQNNNAIHWYPGHLQQGRFGDFIREVKDWALSRDRYWGTPLPIWTCTNTSCGKMICVGSVEELKRLSKTFPKHYDLHKPFVDELEVHCPDCHAVMVREKEVIDCWYDSGSAFFAQWHYPFENQEKFQENFPVDFISEALDQTRGWFYSLLAISTFLFKQNPYRTVLTLGLVLDKENQKMSKSKQNYVDPTIILDHEGADALRWYLFSANAPWVSTRFYEEAVKETLGKFILTYWNSYNFFATYASLDKFNPEKDSVPYEKRGLLDQWILSRFYRLVGDVRSSLDVFDIHKAARAIEQFLIDDFSNWYLRRSRKRLWVEENTQDKLAGYSTIYEIFIGLSKVMAPFTPFITEEIYQYLKTQPMPESIHLCDYPQVEHDRMHDDLEAGMAHIRELVEEGRALRSKININVRYPLPEATIVCSLEEEQLLHNLLELLQEELNVKTISFTRDNKKLIMVVLKPNYARLGPKFKDQAKHIVDTLQGIDNSILQQHLQKQKHYELEVDGKTIQLLPEDFESKEADQPHLVKAVTPYALLFLDTRLTEELEAEGFARELVRRIQSMRKDMDLHVEDHITTEMHLDEPHQHKLKPWLTYMKEETRSKTLTFVSKPKGTLVKNWDIDKVSIEIGLKK